MTKPPAEYRSKIALARHQRVMELMASLTVLPTAVNVPMRIMQMYRSATSPPLEAFAEVIVADGALSAKVLELANSAWFSRARRVTRISDALRMIGLNNLLPLLFGVSLAAIFNKTALPAEERAALWQTSMLKGVVASELAKWRGVGASEEAFLCGVMQDVALPTMFAADRSAALELSAVLDLEDDCTRSSREESMFGVGHAEFGRRICALLQLPPLFCAATATHHSPEGPSLPRASETETTPADIAPCLRVAAAFPHRTQRLDEGATRRMAKAFLASFPETAPSDFANFITRTGAAMKQYTAAFSISDHNGAGMKSFLQDVSDQIARTLSAAIGTTHRTIEQLREAQTQLEGRVHELNGQIARADFDPLTGVLNRRGFLERANKLIALARELEMGCAAGFVDLDDFKLINDTHGHDVGDRALAVVAEALRNMVASQGMIGRCGGDEFAFVLAVPPSVSAETITRDVHQAIKGLSVDTPKGKVIVTASAGIAWLGVPHPSHDIDAALKVADAQMYQIKRNRKTTRGGLPIEPGDKTTQAA